MTEMKPDIDAALEGLDEDRRQTLRRLLLKGAFIAPAVASFGLLGLTEQAAAASGAPSG
jgi:hypothetical protein